MTDIDDGIEKAAEGTGKESQRKEEEEKEEEKKSFFRSGRKSKQRKEEKGLNYEHQADFTLSLNAPSVLPYMPFNDPKGVQLPNAGFRRMHIILAAMSSTVKKNPIPVFAIMMILMIGGVTTAIIYTSVIQPYLNNQQEYQYKLLTHNLTGTDKPPNLFNFQLPGLNLPGLEH